MWEWNYENPKFECDEINGDLLIYSPWSGHRNFIYDFIEYYKPQRVVELGSYYGCSAFAILQSIKDNGLNTEFNAIDTWEGDTFAIYGNENVYGMYKKVNDQFFKMQNSNMLQMTFDEALNEFQDYSIDILHIDGSHSYEDVKHDYLSWKNKVCKKGIILFHDISNDMLYEKEMGSHVFWEELKEEQPYTCEFDFSFGLGIVFLSREVYDDFVSKVDMQKYQRINNELAVNYKDVIRKNHFELMDMKNWILSLQKDKKCLENDNKKLLREIDKIKQNYEDNEIVLKNAYEKSQQEMQHAYEIDAEKLKKYNSELKDEVDLWKKEANKIKADYEMTMQGKDNYILELEKKIEENIH